MVNWNPYLDSLCNAYAKWWQFYTITDVVGQKRVESEPSPLLFDFGLMVQTVERDREERGERQEKVERLTVLEGLRKYVSEHVLLVGRPGSGKSTALARLLLEEAQKAIGNQLKIPVLVELRYYRTSILDLIQDFLQRHDPNLTVDAETIKTWLRQGQLLLLVDGLNELPSEEARRDLHKLRQDYQKTTPMIFTTRDLGVGGDLDIAKKLEMLPLTKMQMQQFVHAYLPQQGEEMLRQLGSRLREFGQTPLLLMMLCSVFADNRNKILSNLGSVFRLFTQIYTNKLKQDIPISGESRRWWHRLLEQLAWVMICGKAKTQLQVAIPRQQAEAVLTEFLAGKVANPEDCALRCLEDLLNHHLIQLGANNQIEFRHQLIQEYYTAESLLKLLPSLDDDELKREYLNYLKWTEPLVLMLELLEDEAQAVRVVRLALQVDLRLGARLAGEVKPKFQGQTVSLVNKQPIYQRLKIQLLGITRSDSAISLLLQALNDEVFWVQYRAVDALAQIGSAQTIVALGKALVDEKSSEVRGNIVSALRKINNDAVIPALLQALADKEGWIRDNAVRGLGDIGTETAISALSQVLSYKDSDIRRTAVHGLRMIGGEAALSPVLQALGDEDREVRKTAIEALGAIIGEVTLPHILQALVDEDYWIRQSAVYALGEIGTEVAVLPLLQALAEEDLSVRKSAVYELGKIGSKTAIPALCQALTDTEDPDFRKEVVDALAKIGSEEALPALLQVLTARNLELRRAAVEALGKIGSEEALPALLQVLTAQNRELRRTAVEALKQIGGDATLLPLLKALRYKDHVARSLAVEALGQISNETAFSALCKALKKDQDSGVRQSAVEVLGKMGSEPAISALSQSLKTDKDGFVRSRIVEVLGQIGSETAFSALIESLSDKDSFVRSSAAKTLGKIGGDAALPAVLTVLEKDEDWFVRSNAIEALGQIGGEAALPKLRKALKDPEPWVRSSAVASLGKIGSQMLLSKGKIDSQMLLSDLLPALQDEDSKVRESSVEVLREIGSSVLLPDLSKLISITEETHLSDRLLNAISEIQKRCQHYNYVIATYSPLVSRKSKPKKSMQKDQSKSVVKRF